jgi:hypothetical protein
MAAESVLDAGFIHKHDRDVIANRIDTVALDTLEPVLICLRQNLGLADGADQNVEQVLADCHESPKCIKDAGGDSAASKPK